MTKERGMQILAAQKDRYDFEYGGEVVAEAPAMRQFLKRMERAAKTDAPILLRGETGAGKSMLAKWIHARSQRSGGPFIGMNCGAITETLIESELFGHERGAFTGAEKRRIGRFEAAQDGTLLLDEIGDAPLSVQVKLLRALQERAIERVGSDGQAIPVNARIIAATNQDLRAGIEKGSFRKDLYYRLCAVPIEIPPLRERREDIPPLISMFVKKHAQGGAPVQFSQNATDILLKYSYPGNVRELEHAIENASIFAEDGVAHVKDLPEDMTRSGGATAHPQQTEPNENGAAQMSMPEEVAQLERTRIEQALRAAKGVQSRAAVYLGISERILRHKLKKYRIDKSRFKR